jgi:hypothetical protein
MPQEQYDNKRIEDELKAGRPERYFDYQSKTYGTTFRTGSIQALETFRELLRQILALGNERSTLLLNVFSHAAPGRQTQDIQRVYARAGTD